MESNLLSVTQLAEELGVDRSTVHRRIDRGDLTPAGYVGNRPVFRREDVEALARGERTLPPEPEAPELPAVGSLWRFKSSKKTYKVRAAGQEFGGLIALQAMDTGANTSLVLADFRARCVPA